MQTFKARFELELLEKNKPILDSRVSVYLHPKNRRKDEVGHSSQ